MGQVSLSVMQLGSVKHIRTRCIAVLCSLTDRVACCSGSRPCLVKPCSCQLLMQLCWGAGYCHLCSEDRHRASYSLMAHYALLSDPASRSRLIANKRLATGLLSAVTTRGAKDPRWVSMRPDGLASMVAVDGVCG